MTKLTGEKLLKTAINQILKHPESWYQQSWHTPCGTKHCIAGWCQILSGKPASDAMAKSDAMKALDISVEDANYLFAGNRTLFEIYSFAEKFSLAGFNRDGFDRDGFDRDGFNRDGFNRDGRKLALFEL